MLATEPEPDGLIHPGQICTTRYLARIWHRKDRRRLEEALERRGIKISRLGNGLSLVRTDDLWSDGFWRSE